MKFRTLVVAVAVLVLLVWIRNGLDWNQLAIPYRAAKLYSAPPDPEIAVPVRGVSKSRVADTWQAPRPGGRKHDGVDIFAPRGTPVLAATRGLVTRTPEGGLGGRAVFVLGPGGRSYYYAHLDDWAPGVKLGRLVEPGTVLGFVGNTGNARNTPPHLHFGIYTPEGPINPLPLLANREKSPQVTVSRNYGE